MVRRFSNQRHQRPDETVDISIVIRSRNEARFLGEVLEQLFAQEYDGFFEVIVLDSGSRDGTLEIARRFPVAVYSMSPDEFSFGRALNRGAQIAKGEYIVYLSAHCTPTDRLWLTRLVEPLTGDNGVVATFGRQEPRQGLNPFEEMELNRIFPSDHADGPSVIFSAANCAISREVVVRFPFDESAPGAEDYIWRRLLPESHHVLYVPEASVYHSHPCRFGTGRADFVLTAS
ncbi:MAG: glycosyltransferase family 2 protein [Candidatus Methylomirabilis sp.]|nr:glycosyltransferase family 2 protein [Candidatus Methylomirabilis sp.]